MSTEGSVEKRLFEEGFAFDFFQAVRLLERLAPQRQPVGRAGPPAAEIARFAAHLSLSFPASKGIHDILRPATPDGLPTMLVTFMGLTGPKGELPNHYTELLIRLDREVKGPERYALREWFDLFNHRFISLFYRAWEKYRFWIPYERGEYDRIEPDPFTQAVRSLIGLGTPGLRQRLRVATVEELDGQREEKPLARIDDLSLLYYSGFFAQRTRCVANLEALVRDYFQIPAQVMQFCGRWLPLERATQSSLAAMPSNNRLGLNVVAGERVWEVQGKFRIRLGPLNYAQFADYLPDRRPMTQRKVFFLLSHLVRLYVGAEFDYDVQLVLRAEDVPACQLVEKDGLGPRLGWNTWVLSRPAQKDAEDAVFLGEELTILE